MMAGMKSINNYFELLETNVSVAENVTSKSEEDTIVWSEIAWQIFSTPDVKVLKTRGS